MAKQTAQERNEKLLATWRAELEGKNRQAVKVHGAAYAMLNDWIEELSLAALAEQHGLSHEEARKAWNMLRDMADVFGEKDVRKAS